MPVDWTARENLMLRVDLLAKDLVYSMYNKALQFYAKTPEVKKILRGFRWGTYIGNRLRGVVCPVCNAREVSNKVWLAGQFMPRLPAHINCACKFKVVLRRAA